MKIKKVAKKLQKMGKGGDTILAHINPEEAAALKAGGGSGKKNPDTGLLSFGGYEGGGTDMADPGGAGGFQGGDWGAAGIGAGNMATDMQTADRATLINGILGGLFGPLGSLAGQFGVSNALAKGFGGGGFFGGGGDYGNDRESGMGGGVGDMDRGAPITPPTLPPTQMFSPAPITQQPFVSKWGKPRTRGYFGG